MKIQKKYSYEPNSTWKIINLADNYFLVNELSMKDYIKVYSRYKALKKVDLPTFGLPTTATIGFLFLSI